MTSSTLALTIDPNRALIDEPVHICLGGLTPYQTVTLQSEMRDGRGRPWRAHASYTADEQGRVDLSVHAPTTGPYSGVDPMGLFWSMSLSQGTAEPSPFAQPGITPTTAEVWAEVEGEPIASATLERCFIADDVTGVDVREDDLRGVFYRPAASGSHPAVLVVAGSTGGLGWAQPMAALLASHGYASFALAYFAHDDLPSDLTLIPLEYFARALRWLHAQADLREQPAAVMGISYGAQLALQLAATYPQIGAVVAYSPSAVLTFGLKRGGPGPVP